MMAVSEMAIFEPTWKSLLAHPRSIKVTRASMRIFLMRLRLTWPFMVTGHDPSSADQTFSKKSPPPLRITMRAKKNNNRLAMDQGFHIAPSDKVGWECSYRVPCPEGKN